MKFDLNINLPSIPGLDKLNQLANELEAPFNSIENAINGLTADLNQFETIITQIENFEKEIAEINKNCTVSIS